MDIRDLWCKSPTNTILYSPQLLVHCIHRGLQSAGTSKDQIEIEERTTKRRVILLAAYSPEKEMILLRLFILDRLRDHLDPQEPNEFEIEAYFITLKDLNISNTRKLFSVEN